MCFLDASNAFDRVKHSVLFSKIVRRGAMDILLDCCYRPLSRRLDRCDRVIQNESRDPFGGNVYYVTMQITFLTRKFRNGERNLHCDVVHIITKWVPSLTLDCNGVFAIKAYWYDKQAMCVRWGNSLSGPFHVNNGVRQGGILSPNMFNVSGEIIINHLMCADDLVLLSPSATGLRELLRTCEK